MTDVWLQQETVYYIDLRARLKDGKLKIELFNSVI